MTDYLENGPQLRARSSLAVGYGGSGENPLSFELRGNGACNVGFLKLFLVHYPTDFGFLKQGSLGSLDRHRPSRVWITQTHSWSVT